MLSTVGPSRFSSHYCINKQTSNKEKVSPKILKWPLVRDMCAFEPKPFKNKTKKQAKHGLYREYGRWLQKETMQTLHTEVGTFPWYILETLFTYFARILNYLQLENRVKSWVLTDVKGQTDVRFASFDITVSRKHKNCIWENNADCISFCISSMFQFLK